MHVVHSKLTGSLVPASIDSMPFLSVCALHEGIYLVSEADA